ncbi:MAG: hypothetical protein ACNA7R_18760, partial [Natronococcus sp.]
CEDRSFEMAVSEIPVRTSPRWGGGLAVNPLGLLLFLALVALGLLSQFGLFSLGTLPRLVRAVPGLVLPSGRRRDDPGAAR